MSNEIVNRQFSSGSFVTTIFFKGGGGWDCQKTNLDFGVYIFFGGGGGGGGVGVLEGELGVLYCIQAQIDRRIQLAF